MKNQKPKAQNPEISSDNETEVGGDVSNSVIVTGSGNVINVGGKKTPSDPSKKKTRQKTKTAHRFDTAIVVALIGFAGTIIAALLASPLSEKLFASVPVSTETATTSFTTTMSLVPSTSSPAINLALTSTNTMEPGLIPTETIPVASALLPTQITDTTGMPMILVTEGAFTMGSNDYSANEKPVHSVSLDSFYIDKYEVTNRYYNLCVLNGMCLPPAKRSSYSRKNYFGDSLYDGYPVIYVTWEMAATYCEWRNARLPSEAEWEKSARGTDGRVYPWGDTIEDTDANYNGLVGDTETVGRHFSGISSYGLFDMAGNVQEWVSDWYQMDYYSIFNNIALNPLGPLTGNERMVRGGSWDAGKNFIRTTYRGKSSPTISYYNIGFRCAKDAP